MRTGQKPGSPQGPWRAGMRCGKENKKTGWKSIWILSSTPSHFQNSDSWHNATTGEFFSGEADCRDNTSYAELPWFTMGLCLNAEKAMAPHSSTLAWKIPWMEEPGRLQSMGSLRVGHAWATSLSLLTFTHWRRKWQPTSVVLPGESQGWGSLVGCHLWGHTESDTNEVT